jgi:hypothetical protein
VKGHSEMATHSVGVGGIDLTVERSPNFFQGFLEIHVCTINWGHNCNYVNLFGHEFLSLCIPERIDTKAKLFNFVDSSIEIGME